MATKQTERFAECISVCVYVRARVCRNIYSLVEGCEKTCFTSIYLVKVNEKDLNYDIYPVQTKPV